MTKIRILWADDEIELLRSHIIFLSHKNYEVTPVNNGNDAIEAIKSQDFDIVFLDEQMPGISGLDVLMKIKQINPSVPVVMITKSEAEDIMEAAIGSKIADYLIKPVNPNQILLSLKKNLKEKELVSQKTTNNYQSEFNRLSFKISEDNNWQDWVEIYKQLVFWEFELEGSDDTTVRDILQSQKIEANKQFAKYVKRNYEYWFEDKCDDKPVLSPNIVKQYLVPELKKEEKIAFLLIDNLRYDHWISLKKVIQDYYSTTSENLYYSILPTTTQYSRNSIFAGLMPLAIEKIHPELWKNDDDDGLKNLYEEEMLVNQLKRFGYNNKISFEKVSAVNAGKKLGEKIKNLLSNQLFVLIYNFVDTLSHSRTEMDLVKELASDEATYRSLTLSWFKHSPLLEAIKTMANEKVKLIITTDHGAIKVNNPVKILGDRNVTTNLRYKNGKALQFQDKQVFKIEKPKSVQLPATNLSTSYAFCTSNDFFVYPNNYNQYVNLYNETFQHGGISLEEMLIPVIVMNPK